MVLIREIRVEELPLLKDFLYESIFQRDDTNLLPRSIINQPEFKVYLEDFGKPDDFCLVAVAEEHVVGAVWSRILAGEVKGFGNVDTKTPELAISVYKAYRGKGAGTALLAAMLQGLTEIGYSQVSLSVQKDNYAMKMYEKAGFLPVHETDEEAIMVCSLPCTTGFGTPEPWIMRP